jgi:hypothetical protein
MRRFSSGGIRKSPDARQERRGDRIIPVPRCPLPALSPFTVAGIRLIARTDTDHIDPELLTREQVNRLLDLLEWELRALRAETDPAASAHAREVSAFTAALLGFSVSSETSADPSACRLPG